MVMIMSVERGNAIPARRSFQDPLPADQEPGQPVRHGIQPGIAQNVAAADQGGCVRGSAYLAGEQIRINTGVAKRHRSR